MAGDPRRLVTIQPHMSKYVGAIVLSARELMTSIQAGAPILPGISFPLTPSSAAPNAMGFELWRRNLVSQDPTQKDDRDRAFQTHQTERQYHYRALENGASDMDMHRTLRSVLHTVAGELELTSPQKVVTPYLSWGIEHPQFGAQSVRDAIYCRTEEIFHHGAEVTEGFVYKCPLKRVSE